MQANFKKEEHMEYKNPMTPWALAYLDVGLPPIPAAVIGDEKVPFVKWKALQKELPTSGEVLNWFEEYKPNSGIGIVTGPNSGIIVLDVEEEGLETIKQFSIPNTWTVKTARGYHYYFKWSGELDEDSVKSTVAAKFGKGVDFRGRKGFLMVPPSINMHGGRYEWVEGSAFNQIPLAECPQFIIDILTAKPNLDNASVIATKEPWLEELLQGVGDGLRHQSLIKLGGYYFNHFPPEVALIHLREWNKKNNPPIDENEFEEQLTDLKSRFANGEYRANFKEKIPRNLDIISAETLVRDYSKAPQYLVHRLIPQAARTIFSGWQGRGKSMAMSDLVIEVSRKKGLGKWMGHLPVQQGAVIYIDNENAANLVSHRMTQLLTPKGLTTSDLNLHFVIGKHFKMTSESDYIWLKEQIKEIQPILVVMDSLASCHALDENQSSTMRFFFDDLIAPLCEEFGTGFLCIDHERKDTIGLESSGGKRLRGSSAKGDAVDCILSLNEKDGIVFMEHSKSRYSKRQQPLITTIEDVSNGIVVRAKEHTV